MRCARKGSSFTKLGRPRVARTGQRILRRLGRAGAHSLDGDHTHLDLCGHGMHDPPAIVNNDGRAWKPVCLQTRKPAFVRFFSCRAAAPSMAGRVGPASAGPVPVGRFPPPRRSATRRGKRERITHRITGAVIMRRTTSDPVSVADRPASSSPEHPRSTLRFHPEAEQALHRLPFVGWHHGCWRRPKTDHLTG